MADKPNIPEEIADAYNSAIVAYADNPDQAHDQAMRMVRHAGWYESSDGWRQLGPDVRDKVNVRKAEPQSDGTYVICDVDIFYPNAVKGEDKQFDPQRNGQIIQNTNAGIEQGGQRPGLTKIHPSPFSKMAGTFIPSYGHAINFRQSPRGKGWIRCDLADVPKDVYEDWKNRRITGLSAGIVEDAEGLNERIGHIAMLGGESQALSQLPITEIYSIENQICFSADDKGIAMDEKKKKFFGAMKNCYSKFAAAFAAFESDEPTAGDKLKEANDEHDRVSKEHGEEGEHKKPAFDATGMNRVPVEPELKPTQPPETVETPSIAAYSAQTKKLEEEVRQLKLMNLAIVGKQAKMDFSAMCADLKTQGHEFDQEWADKMFEASINNKTSLDLLFEGLRKSPKKMSPASVTVFGAGGQDPATAPKSEDEEKEVLKQLRKAFPGATFDASFLKLGLAMSGNSKKHQNAAN